MSAFDGRAFGSWVVTCLAALVLAGCGGGGVSSDVVTKNVLLVGAQENPSVTTAATGSGFVSIDRATGDVTANIVTFGINANVAHIHQGAVGVNAPVIVPLAQGPSGTWTVPAGGRLTSTQLAALAAGNLYVNVHTTANPGGEIRDQIGREVLFAILTGSQETPPVSTAASGTGRFVFDPDTRTISGSVTTAALTGTVAHLHIGAAGVAAPPAITATGGPANWTIAPTVLTDQQAADLLAGRFYFNVHSAANAGGEIRGQLFSSVARAELTGAAEVPPVNSTATGTGWLSVNPTTKAVAGRIETSLLEATNAHVHRSPVGVAGGVVIPMSNPSPGVWVIPAGTIISDDLLAALMRGELYYNVHTAANPSGEIRGQLVPVI